MSADWENLSKKPKDAVEATISDVNAQTLRIAAGEFAALSAGGYQFRCVVTDANDKKVTSNAAAFTMKGSPSVPGSDGTNVLTDGEFLCYVGDVFRVQNRGIVIQTRVVAGRVNARRSIMQKKRTASAFASASRSGKTRTAAPMSACWRAALRSRWRIRPWLPCAAATSAR